MEQWDIIQWKIPSPAVKKSHAVLEHMFTYILKDMEAPLYHTYVFVRPEVQSAFHNLKVLSEHAEGPLYVIVHRLFGGFNFPIFLKRVQYLFC